MPTASTFTGNLNLEKQASDQYYDITVVNDNLQLVDDAFGRNHVIATLSNVSSFGANGVSYTDPKITKKHRVVNMVLSNPEAQKGDWTYDVIDGKITLKGTVSGTTNITLFLVEVNDTGLNGVTNMKISSCFNLGTKVFSASTLANVESALVTFGASMADSEFRNIKIAVTQATEVFDAATHFGIIKRYDANRFVVNLQGVGSPDQSIVGIYTSTNAWTWAHADNSVLFGDLTKTLQTVLTENWQTAILNARQRPTPVLVQADNTNYYGFLSRYSTRYGSGILTRYDGKAYACFMNNSTVTVRFAGMETTSLGSGTLANMQSAIATFGGTMSNLDFRNISFAITPAEGIFNATTYLGTIKKVNATRFIVSIQGASTPGQSIKGIYNNGTWSWCLEGLYYVTDASAFSSFEAGCERGGTSTTLAKQGRIATMSGSIKITSAFTSDYSQLFTINETFKPLREVEFVATDLSTNKTYAFYIRTTGEVCSRPAVPVANLIVFNASWVTETYS